MRAAWLTDIHLNFVAPERAAALCGDIEACGADAVLVTGDIAEGIDIDRWLRFMAARISRPIYFVLGNHDFYGASITAVRARVRRVCAEIDHLHWLPDCGTVALGTHTALVGHDGWADARLGDFAGSPIVLTDYLAIADLAPLADDRSALATRLAALGDEAAAHFRTHLPGALAAHSEVIALIHPPPFRASCIYRGRVSDPDWLPHMSCAAAGEAMRAALDGVAGAASGAPHPASRRERQRESRPRPGPDATRHAEGRPRLTVLCGHTHGNGLSGPATSDPYPGLRVLTGGAEYGQPAIQAILEVR
ncbi:MAG: metallophosphoesterase [Candidatus Eiseniibacteriota bacterium]|jgi:hypothetical protein